MRACGQKLVKFCTHTHSTAAKLVVRIKQITMRSILKKIAVCKNDKENIGPVYGSGRRSHKLSIGSLPSCQLG